MAIKKHWILPGIVLGFVITACSESAVEVIDPFKTSDQQPLDEQIRQRYEKRIINKEQSDSIITAIKTAQEKAKQEGSGFVFQNIEYVPESKQINIKKLQLEPESMATMPYMSPQDFDNDKDIRLSWFDNSNEVPHYLFAVMNDSFTPTAEFLASPDGQQYQQFFKAIKADGSSLKNTAEFAYDYNPKNGELKFSIRDDFHQLFHSRLVLKIDGLSKATMDMLNGTDNKAPDPSLLLGMLSGVRIQEMHIKMKMERSIEEVFKALPEQDAKMARKDYLESKQLSEENIKKMAGKNFSLQQLQQYRQSWFNFLEQKQPIVISILPDVPQPLPTFFTAAMMAQSNPKILANLFKQLNLKITNQSI